MQNANIYGDPLELWLGAPDQPAVDMQHIILSIFCPEIGTLAILAIFGLH